MERRAVTSGGLIKTTVQLTEDQIRRLDEATPPHGSRSDLVRRYVEQGLDRDRRLARVADALEPVEVAV